VRVAPNYETEEGARGSGAARQSNCHRVTKVRGPPLNEEKSAKCLRPTPREPSVGSAKNGFPFARWEPIRALVRHVERSVKLPSFEAQRLPFSNAILESHELGLGHPPHGSAKVCADAISHSTGNNEAKATFTRSITTYRFDNPPLTSFISIWCARPFICSNSSMTFHNPAITNARRICTQYIENPSYIRQPENCFHNLSASFHDVLS